MVFTKSNKQHSTILVLIFRQICEFFNHLPLQESTIFCDLKSKILSKKKQKQIITQAVEQFYAIISHSPSFY